MMLQLDDSQSRAKHRRHVLSPAQASCAQSVPFSLSVRSLEMVLLYRAECVLDWIKGRRHFPYVCEMPSF